MPGGTPVAGDTVLRYSLTGDLQTIGSACSGTVTTTSCTEEAVPAGSWRYSVTPRQGNWSGTESPLSTTVAVVGPDMTLTSSSNVTSLPATLGGTLAGLASGQTVTYRLDDPSSGTVLSGTTTPSTIGLDGAATFSVTLPIGTSNGSHRIYAVGSGGDTASASVTVAASTTITTSAWNLRDGSTGTLADESAPSAFSGDGRTFNTGNWGTAFSPTRYVEFDSNTTLPAGKAVSGAAFNYRRAATTAGDTVCHYLEVRRISTGAVLGTHGSSATPAGCVTGTAMTTTSTPLPEIASTDVANDARIRIYTRSTAALATTIDLATLSGTAGSTPFTLYTRNYIDTSAGGAPASYPWSQIAADGTLFAPAGTWNTSFQSTRYLRATFPAYVPTGATVTGTTLRHRYRPVTSGNNACWYAEVYSGGALIGTHGSSLAPIGCNSSNTTWATDSVTLPAVNTPGRANDLTVRLYFRGSASGSGRRTEHDLTEVGLTYSE
jgi:hypothetical protein